MANETLPAEPRLKLVTYWCRGCRREVERHLRVAHFKYRSHCSRAGRDVTMKRLRWDYA